MIHRLVNLDYPETQKTRRMIEARQLASRRVTVARREPYRSRSGLKLVTTPTRLRNDSGRWRGWLLWTPIEP